MSRALRRRYGHSQGAAEGMHYILSVARGQGATQFEPSGVNAKPTVYRPDDRGWQAAIVKPMTGGGFYLSSWDWAPFREAPHAGVPIEDAIRRAT